MMKTTGPLKMGEQLVVAIFFASLLALTFRPYTPNALTKVEATLSLLLCHF